MWLQSEKKLQSFLGTNKASAHLFNYPQPLNTPMDQMVQVLHAEKLLRAAHKHTQKFMARLDDSRKGKVKLTY